jgi:hypothetical protein
MAAITSPFDADFDAAAARIRELSDKMVTAAKQAGTMSLDTYEQTMSSLLDFGQKLADSTKVEQISEIAKSQASIINTVTSAYTQAARDLLK